MQHKGVIQSLMGAEARLAAQVVIFFMDLRGLREAGLLFVHGLGNENPRIVFVQFQQQRGGVRHHRDKLLVANPRRVKQHVIAQGANLIDHLTCVVDGAVVSAKLNDRQAERTRLVGLFRRNFADKPAQIRFVETVVVNAANKAEGVAGGLKIDRRRPRLYQRAMMVGFMVVAVEQHQVAAGQQRVGDHFVGGGGAVKHKVGFIRVEHLRREFLRVFGGAFMDQQVAQLDVGVTHVGAKDVLAEEIVKLPPRRMLFEKFTVLMPRTGEGVVFHLHVLAQGVKKGRQQIFFIFTGGGFQLQPVLLFTVNNRRHPFRQFDRLMCE